jgi:CheY-like chemotaxis protein/HPt (histidine-containing phosphotransfer) domain-containing protein
MIAYKAYMFPALYIQHFLQKLFNLFYRNADRKNNTNANDKWKTGNSMASTEELLAELKEAYINGFHTQTSEIEGYLIGLEKDANFQETFEALYRRIHNIKGTAGSYGFSIVSSICHQMEDYLTDNVTFNSYKGPDVINILFDYLDLLSETRDGLISGKIDNFLIEQSLERIARKSTSSTIKCLCVGLTDTVYQKIVKEIASDLNIQLAFVDNGLIALERLVHEQFDAMITTRENTDLNGLALIGALRLNKRKNALIKAILTTSNAKIDVPTTLRPDYTVMKNQSFATNLEAALTQICNA